MVAPEDRTYPSADGSPLPMRVWAPDGRPAATLLSLHGIQSHSGWYEVSSRALAEAGACVYQLERRGSGLDEAHERGHVDRAETWIADVEAAADLAAAETGHERVHLMGVSWGGKLALACGAYRPALYRSLVVAAPGLFTQIDLGTATKARVVACLATGKETARFAIPLRAPALFTANPVRQRYIAEDPLSLREVTARFLFESRRLDRYARRARQCRLPVLLALAGQDRITDNAVTRAFVSAMPSDRAKIVTYPEGHHTLEFDPAPAAYVRDLVRWVAPPRAEGSAA